MLSVSFFSMAGKEDVLDLVELKIESPCRVMTLSFSLSSILAEVPLKS